MNINFAKLAEEDSAEKCPLEKVKLHKHFEHSPWSVLKCCARNVRHFSNGASLILLLFVKLVRILLTVIVLFQGGTATALSELSFRSSTCNCDQSLGMAFRWETGGLNVSPVRSCRGARYIANSPKLLYLSNSLNQLSGRPPKMFIS